MLHVVIPVVILSSWLVFNVFALLVEALQEQDSDDDDAEAREPPKKKARRQMPVKQGIRDFNNREDINKVALLAVAEQIPKIKHLKEM